MKGGKGSLKDSSGFTYCQNLQIGHVWANNYILPLLVINNWLSFIIIQVNQNYAAKDRKRKIVSISQNDPVGLMH